MIYKQFRKTSYSFNDVKTDIKAYMFEIDKEIFESPIYKQYEKTGARRFINEDNEINDNQFIFIRVCDVLPRAPYVQKNNTFICNLKFSLDALPTIIKWTQIPDHRPNPPDMSLYL